MKEVKIEKEVLEDQGSWITILVIVKLDTTGIRNRWIVTKLWNRLQYA